MGPAIVSCTTPGDDLAVGFNVVEVVNPDALTKDAASCRAYALAYKSSLSLAGVAASGAQGALENAPSAILNPLIPAIGAAGSAGSSVAAWLGALPANRDKVFWQCMRAKAGQNYLVLEPP